MMQRTLFEFVCNALGCLHVPAGGKIKCNRLTAETLDFCKSFSQEKNKNIKSAICFTSGLIIYQISCSLTQAATFK